MLPENSTNLELFLHHPSRGFISSGLFARSGLVSYVKPVALPDMPARGGVTVVANIPDNEIVNVLAQLPPLDWHTGQYLEDSRRVLEANRRAQKPMFNEQY